MNKRQTDLNAFDQSESEFVIGNLDQIGIQIEELTEIDESNDMVCQVIESGLTGVIYQINKNAYYNLKKKRKSSKVNNIDGQLSFLNELICRDKIMKLGNAFESLKNGIVETVYGNYRKGILLSKWIEGSHPNSIDMNWIEQVVEIALDLQKIGLFEWDLSLGNILIEDDKVKLFDFGYCYQFDPLNEFNSDGVNAPAFHALERLETRYLMLALSKHQNEHGKDMTLALYGDIIKVGIKGYQKHLDYLVENGAAEPVVNHFRSIINEWEKGISTEENLNYCFMKDTLRSHILDIHDDLSGESCTPDTLLRIQHLREIAETANWETLKSMVNQESKKTFLKDLDNYYNKAVVFQQKH